jgi:lipoyl(octanoyl) transferase
MDGFRVVDLGLISFDTALERQLEAHEEVLAGGPDTLFLLEHEKVVTFGRHGGQDNLHVSPAWLAEQGVALAETTRGGDVTCHFPGQMVAYPVFRIERRPGGVARFFHDLEEAVMATLAAFGVPGDRREGQPGVWTGRGKIASIGIAVKRWVSYHGVSLNVGPDVSLFGCMTLCGITGARPTSIAIERGDDAVGVKDVKDEFARHIRRLFAHPAVAAGQAAGGRALRRDEEAG